MEPMTDALKIVTDFQQALGKGDFEAARRLLDDRMSFHGPFDTFHSPEPYLDSLRKLSNIVDRVEIRKAMSDGNDVCLFYDTVTNTVGTALIAEWFEVSNGKISKIHAAFDARPFAPMFDASARPSSEA